MSALTQLISIPVTIAASASVGVLLAKWRIKSADLLFERNRVNISKALVINLTAEEKEAINKGVRKIRALDARDEAQHCYNKNIK